MPTVEIRGEIYEYEELGAEEMENFNLAWERMMFGLDEVHRRLYEMFKNDILFAVKCGKAKAKKPFKGNQSREGLIMRFLFPQDFEKSGTTLTKWIQSYTSTGWNYLISDTGNALWKLPDGFSALIIIGFENEHPSPKVSAIKFEKAGITLLPIDVRENFLNGDKEKGIHIKALQHSLLAVEGQQIRMQVYVEQTGDDGTKPIGIAIVEDEYTTSKPG